ncbi:DoxX family protein [Porphyromonas canoris]|nr:DoxX family protein [Porphyromonas canoris]KGN66936.1 DoxX family protein [Porphyromonas sp. COT-108 OH1349]KGN93852.1 DoxX family protein [Porphyromonas sp. COT-108 OH2963]
MIMDRNKDLGILILRLSIGVMMLLHGIAKLQGGMGPVQGMLEAKSLPAFIAYGVYIGEILAPLLLILGARTRLAALLFVFNCIAIIWLGGHPVFSLNQYGGWGAELPGLFLFGALALFFTGGGKYAVSTKNKWD